MPLRDLAVMQLEFLGMAMATLFGMTYTTQVKPEDFLSLPTGCAAPTTAVSSFQSYAAKVLVLAPPNCLCCFFLLCLLDGRARMATTKLLRFEKVLFFLYVREMNKKRKKRIFRNTCSMRETKR